MTINPAHQDWLWADVATTDVVRIHAPGRRKGRRLPIGTPGRVTQIPLGTLVVVDFGEGIGAYGIPPLMLRLVARHAGPQVRS
jgi:hypothetical protein